MPNNDILDDLELEPRSKFSLFRFLLKHKWKIEGLFFMINLMVLAPHVLGRIMEEGVLTPMSMEFVAYFIGLGFMTIPIVVLKGFAVDLFIAPMVSSILKIESTSFSTELDRVIFAQVCMTIFLLLVLYFLL
ncbi:MAG: hypothetical protein GY810_11665 [Aureispira sp.]|nr:hypothetical protein [Aureispira sp.]